MIMLKRLNGHEFALNCDLIERIDSTPDTVITLVDGTKYVVEEPVQEVIDRTRAYRASIIANAEWVGRSTIGRAHLSVVPMEGN